MLFGYSDSARNENEPLMFGFRNLLKALWQNVYPLVKLNLVFLLFCIPVITVPAAVTALHGGCVDLIRGERVRTFRLFLKTERSLFFQSWAVLLILLVPCMISVMNAWFYFSRVSDYLWLLVPGLVMSAKDHQENRTDDGYSYFQWSPTGMDTHNPGINNYIDWLVEKGIKWSEVYDAPVMGYWPPKGDYPIPSRIKGMPNELHQTTWCVEKALEFVRQSVDEDAQRPWCVSINPFAPHPPFDPPQEFKDRIDVNDMPLPLWKEGELDNKPAFQKESYLNGFQSRMLVPGVRVTDEEKRENTREYYALIEHLDYQLGRLIDYLEETDQRKNTIIMFMSDHGECLGDHGLFWKGGLFYECNIHVPLVISCPGYIKEGLRVPALVELADVAPTILELVGLPVPHYMQAKSFAGILTGTASPAHHKDAVYAEYYCSALASNHVYATMYFDGRYKMIVHHNDPVSELYDLQNDPNEFDNLWGKPEHLQLCFEYHQKCFNHAVLVNEDTVLGKKQVY